MDLLSIEILYRRVHSVVWRVPDVSEENIASIKSSEKSAEAGDKRSFLRVFRTTSQVKKEKFPLCLNN
jgi:hypothetical protein